MSAFATSGHFGRERHLSRSESTLVLAGRHVCEGRLIVARQKQLIARLKAAGRPTLNAEQTLQVFVTTLAIFEDHVKGLSSA
jgi:hypothetical protein